MTRPSKAEEAILLASDNSAVADYLVARGTACKSPSGSGISMETEVSLLERGDRLIDLRLAEYCLHEKTAQMLFHRDPEDSVLRSLILSNQAIGGGWPIPEFPTCIFGNEDGLLAYFATITIEEVQVLFVNPALGDNFLENVLSLKEYWQAMSVRSRQVMLSNLANNPKMQKPVRMADYDDGENWVDASQPFDAAWRLVVNLEATSSNAFHLSWFYQKLAPYCLDREGILEALPRWVAKTPAEKQEEDENNKKGELSPYQNIRRATAAMLLGTSTTEQDTLVQSDDIAVRCGAYVAGRFTPDEMKTAIERDGWIATVSLMQNPKCWRTAEHRDALDVALGSLGNEVSRSIEQINWEYRWWSEKFEKDHPDWFEFDEFDVEPEDRPLMESSIGELARNVFSSPAFTTLNARIEAIVHAQRVQFWILIALLAIIIFRR